MIASHLSVISKLPAPACDVPTAPAFITTFQCLGQFILGIFGQFDGGGFAALGTLATALNDFLIGESGLFTVFFMKGNISA